jgi:glutathione S-transferase
VRRRVRAEFNINADSITVAYEKLAAAGARFRAELQPSGYLVGRSFSVADLTLAALIAPLVAPSEFPYPQPQRRHPLLRPLREALATEGLLYWTRSIYARHRGCSAASTRPNTPADHRSKKRVTRRKAADSRQAGLGSAIRTPRTNAKAR